MSENINVVNPTISNVFGISHTTIAVIKSHFFTILIVLIGFSTSSHSIAREVTQTFRGLELNAELELAESKSMSDQLILIVHGGLAHRDMESLRYLRALLKENQFATLSINLSLGINNRHGMYDCQDPHQHTNDDALDEIDVWIEWLKKLRVKQIVLLGHSRGGAQIALHAVERNQKIVTKIILLAPATKDNGAINYQKRYKQELEPILEKATHLVNQGKGQALIEHANVMFCFDTNVSAKTIVSYFGEVKRLDTPWLLPKIAQPTLVIVARDDKVVVGLDKKIQHLLKPGQLDMKVIDDSDHLFRDLNMDEAVDSILEFL